MQRRFWKAGLKAPLLISVSARALIIRVPDLRVLGPRGTSPQWKASRCRVLPSSSTAYTSWVGATLYDGSNRASGASVPK